VSRSVPPNYRLHPTRTAALPHRGAILQRVAVRAGEPQSRYAPKREMGHEGNPSTEFIARLDDLDFARGDSSAEERLYELVKLLEHEEAPSSVFPAIFRFFERNEGVEIGNPGPLVHFLEQFYPEYLKLLVESVRRRPVEHTVWMVNRILNDASISEFTRQSLLRLLQITRDNPELNETIRRSAGGFLGFQQHGA
jgi:hypothetical protein